MVAENELAAAKAAALQHLEAENTNGDLIQNGRPSTAVSKKTRRRRRKRSLKEQKNDPSFSHTAENPEQSKDIEYVPEDLPRDEEEQNDQNAEPLTEVLAAMKRFSQRNDSNGDYIEKDEDYESSGNDADVDKNNQDESGDSEQDKSNKERLSKDNIPADDKDDVNNLQNEKHESDQSFSRKKLKEIRRSYISILKTHCDQPQVIDSWDVDSRDPFLLVKMKTWPNSVTVPSIWRMKRKYLQNKRGMEKRPFELPAYIAETGVGALRDAQIEADEKKTMKQKQREKMRAKTGRGVEIDTTRLHDAFFKFQTKPRLTAHGDLYYELRELEADGSHFRPGVISEQLCAALGMKKGGPPPWLVSMQRFGPPPGYPGLKIPGLNCPIPPGAKFGYQEGGWGKVPVDTSGIPLYGDVFEQGIQFEAKSERFDWKNTQKEKLWGELETVNEDGLHITIDEKEDKSDENEVENEVETRVNRLRGEQGSTKKVDENREPEGQTQKQLYKVLETRKVSVGDNSRFGSNYVYKLGENEENERETSGDKKRRQEERKESDEYEERSRKRRDFKF